MTQKERLELLKGYLLRALYRASDDTGIEFSIKEQKQALQQIINEL